MMERVPVLNELKCFVQEKEWVVDVPRGAVDRIEILDL
jgi:hypothetical protein